MNSRTASRRRTKYTVVAVSAILGLLAFFWALWFLALLAFGDVGYR